MTERQRRQAAAEFQQRAIEAERQVASAAAAGRALAAFLGMKWSPEPGVGAGIARITAELNERNGWPTPKKKIGRPLAGRR